MYKGGRTEDVGGIGKGGEGSTYGVMGRRWDWRREVGMGKGWKFGREGAVWGGKLRWEGEGGTDLGERGERWRRRTYLL